MFFVLAPMYPHMWQDKQTNLPTHPAALQVPFELPKKKKEESKEDGHDEL